MSDSKEKVITNDMKTCFIVTPIGGDKSDIRRHADGVINSVLRPLLIDKFEFEEVVAAHEISKSGSINNQVMNRVIDSDLVIANLTGLNPNVMYELAVRHTTQKPIIHICDKETSSLPFDIAEQRTIFYTNDMLGVQELSKKLVGMLEQMTNLTICNDNPIYNSRRQQMIYKELDAGSGSNDIIKYIISTLDSMNEKVTIGREKKNERNTDEIQYKYIDDFKVKVSASEYDFDRELFETEVKTEMEKKDLRTLKFECLKTEEYNNTVTLYYSLNLGSNNSPPYTYDIESALKNMFFNEIIEYKVDGNKGPF